ARVVVTSKRHELDELLRFNFREDPGSVSITARRKHGRFFGWVRSGESVHWEIQVPDRTQIDIDTSGGAIRIAGLRGDAKLQTSRLRGGPSASRGFAVTRSSSPPAAPLRLATTSATCRAIPPAEESSSPGFAERSAWRPPAAASKAPSSTARWAGTRAE